MDKQFNNNELTIQKFDRIIDKARAELYALDPAVFGGQENRARIEASIGAQAPKGTIAVPYAIDTGSAQGLMAGVDLTLLDKKAEPAAVKALAQRAKDESAATVCVYPEHVQLVQDVTGGNPPPIAVVGFPAVAHPGDEVTQETLQQMRAAIAAGAKEIDMVLANNFKDGNPDYAVHYNYIRAVVAEADKSNVPVKVILETAYLTDEQIVEASLIAKMAGAAFVKTSTGFAEKDQMIDPDGPKGATAYDVALMRRTVGDTTLNDQGQAVAMGVKASGGVRTRDDAIAVYKAGASRIGASGGIDVRNETEKLLQRDDSRRHASGGRTGY